MKRKAIHAQLRKESEKFEGWLKYEVTIQNPDGTTETIPAYGKDLQDALSRVVHDDRVEKVEERVKRIPDLVWAILWFGYILGWTMLTYAISPYTKLNGIFFVCGIGLITLITLLGKSWFRKRNKDR
jgi:hypothetical protein